MPVYTIKNVSPDTREWSSKQGGTFVSYTIDLEHDGVVEMGVEWARKPESKAPTPGEEVAGHVEEGRFGPKFKMDYEATKELSQGQGSSRAPSAPSGGSKGNWQPEHERDPQRSARILRQHSQEMAVRVVDAMGLFTGLGPASPLKDWAAAEDWIKRWTDFFDQDVIAAGQAATQGAGAASPAPHSQDSQGASPGSAPASAPESQPADTAQYFTKLLEDAAMDPAAALELGKYIAHKFSPEQRKRAENGLRELGSQQDTVKRLTSAYEKSEGKLLPLSTDDDGEEVPF